MVYRYMLCKWSQESSPTSSPGLLECFQCRWHCFAGSWKGQTFSWLGFFLGLSETDRERGKPFRDNAKNISNNKLGSFQELITLGIYDWGELMVTLTTEPFICRVLYHREHFGKISKTYHPELPGWRVTLLPPSCQYDEKKKLKYAFSSLMTSPGGSLSARTEHTKAGDERWV